MGGRIGESSPGIFGEGKHPRSEGGRIAAGYRAIRLGEREVWEE